MTSTADAERAIAERAALKIQCLFRCRQARRTTDSLRKRRSDTFEAEQQRDLEVAAAITLQAVQRRLAAKKRVNARRLAQNRDAAADSGRDVHVAVQPPSLTASTDVRLPQPVVLGSSTQSTPLPLTVSGAFAESLLSLHDSPSVNRSMGSFGRAGLTTAFALSSVASLSCLRRDDPLTAQKVIDWDVTKFSPTLIHECAALVIQCKWRVFTAVRKVRAMQLERKLQRVAQDDQQLNEIAAITIQKNFRGHAQRRDRPASARTARSSPGGTGRPARRNSAPTGSARLPPDAAALRIQCMIRCRIARKTVKSLRKQRSDEFDAEVRHDLEHDAARLIQSHQRRRQAQQKMRTHSLNGSQMSASSARSNPPRLRARDATTVAGAVAEGSGRGLSSLFYTAGGVLLESSGVDRCLLWGVRILHAVTMDVVVAGKDQPARRLPALEFSRWVQGPLGSVLPHTRAAAASPTQLGRLPALAHTTGGDRSPNTAALNQTSPETRKKLQPLTS